MKFETKLKTTKAVIHSYKTDSVIICLNEKRKQNILNIAEIYNINIIKPVTVAQIKNTEDFCGIISEYGGRIIIDDIADVFGRLMGCGVQIEMITNRTYDYEEDCFDEL